MPWSGLSFLPVATGFSDAARQDAATAGEADGPRLFSRSDAPGCHAAVGARTETGTGRHADRDSREVGQT